MINQHWKSVTDYCPLMDILRKKYQNMLGNPWSAKMISGFVSFQFFFVFFLKIVKCRSPFQLFYISVQNVNDRSFLVASDTSGNFWMHCSPEGGVSEFIFLVCCSAFSTAAGLQSPCVSTYWKWYGCVKPEDCIDLYDTSDTSCWYGLWGWNLASMHIGIIQLGCCLSSPTTAELTIRIYYWSNWLPSPQHKQRTHSKDTLHKSSTSNFIIYIYNTKCYKINFKSVFYI